MNKLFFILFIKITFLFVFNFSINYCDVEKNFCKMKQHVACENSINILANKEIVQNMTRDDIELIINWINKFRNDLAFGKIPKSPEVSNLNIVSWDEELEMFSSNALMYSLEDNICSVTVNGSETEFIIFHDDENGSIKNFIEKSFNNYRDPELKAIWNFLYDSESNKIGCNYLIQGENHFNMQCFTNKILFENLNDAYLKGKPCTKCLPNFQCDKIYKGLCVKKKEMYLNKTNTQHSTINKDLVEDSIIDKNLAVDHKIQTINNREDNNHRNLYIILLILFIIILLIIFCLITILCLSKYY